MLGTPGLATAADYSEAMGIARRAKSVIALILLLMLLLQVTTFFLARYHVIPMPGDAPVALPVLMPVDTSDAAAKPVVAPVTPAVVATTSSRMTDIAHYLTGVSLLGAIGLGVVLVMILILILHIMLVGRLIGVGKVTSSLVWCLLLVVFLFPWQTFMNNAELSNTDFRVPGVLWTWGELARGYNFSDDFSADGFARTILGWFRFAGAPLVAIIMTLMIQLKSNRGIKMAMGEDEVLNDLMGQA